MTDDADRRAEAIVRRVGEAMGAWPNTAARDLIAAAIRDAASKTVPQWTRTPPSAPGLYWHRTEWEPVPVILRVCRGAIEVNSFYAEGLEGMALRSATGGEWCGPLEEPA